MLHIRSLREGLPLFRALGSETRVKILEMLVEKGPMRMTAIAEALGITGGALTSHVRQLNETGLVAIELKGGRHGIQKLCRVNEERLVIELLVSRKQLSLYETELGIGQFTACEVTAPCGIAAPAGLIGDMDDPVSFLSPERLKAGILWFDSGYVEYMVPNFLKAGEEPQEVQVSLELAACLPINGEAGGGIAVSINGRELGSFPGPEDCGREGQGIYNPAWWPKDRPRRGFYKLLTVNHAGTFVDGSRISPVTLKDLRIRRNTSFALRFTVAQPGGGGLALFGSSFGNYPQGIRVQMHYAAKGSE